MDIKDIVQYFSDYMAASLCVKGEIERKAKEALNELKIIAEAGNDRQGIHKAFPDGTSDHMRR